MPIGLADALCPIPTETKSSSAAKRARRIEQRLNHAKRPGHEPTLGQQTMLACFASIDPTREPVYAAKLSAIGDALENRASWDETDEWRFSTWFDARIEKTVQNGEDWYKLSVEMRWTDAVLPVPQRREGVRLLELYKRLGHRLWDASDQLEIGRPMHRRPRRRIPPRSSATA